MLSLISDISVLDGIVADNVLTIKEAKKIANELFETIAMFPQCKALSAPQCGINKNVFVVIAREPIFFANCKILEGFHEIDVLETNIHAPKKIFATHRYCRIYLESLSFNKPVYFGYDKKKDDGVNLTSPIILSHPVIQESIYIQQMLDIINGNIKYIEYANKPTTDSQGQDAIV